MSTTTTNGEWFSVDSDGKQSKTSFSSSTSITTPSKTDIWRPSAEQNDFNAPYIYTSIQSSTFQSLKVTVSAEWKTQFDQGGLLIIWPAKDGVAQHDQWVKTGIEYFNGEPALSVVGCDRFSDWSLCRMPKGSKHATLEAERVDRTLWVYSIVDGKKVALRETKWAFLESGDDQAEMRVGIYAAKPTPESDPGTGIEVKFEGLELRLSE